MKDKFKEKMRREFDKRFPNVGCLLEGRFYNPTATTSKSWKEFSSVEKKIKDFLDYVIDQARKEETKKGLLNKHLVN